MILESMKVSCPACSAKYNVDENRIPAGGLRMRCPKCGASFRVDASGAAPVEEAPAATGPTPAPQRPSDLSWGGSPSAAGGADLPVPKPGGSSDPAAGAGDIDLPVPKATGAEPSPPGGGAGWAIKGMLDLQSVHLSQSALKKLWYSNHL